MSTQSPSAHPFRWASSLRAAAGGNADVAALFWAAIAIAMVKVGLVEAVPW